MLQRTELALEGLRLPLYSANTVVVGSGAAGLACAVRLWREMAACGTPHPERQIAVVTEGLGTGTSHNAGSDKQTYYKLGSRPDEPDSALDFARTLTAAGCTHGDTALVEGLNSLRCFHFLVELGVPFPQDGLGGFVGYRTDHDPRGRATSAGPWTSRLMVRALAAELRRCGIPVFEGHRAVALVTADEGGPVARGLVCVELDRQEAEDHGLVLFNCRNVVVAGGGPGELFAHSVYPRGQIGPFAMLLEAGAAAENLTESQFGIASVSPRWNLSGTYQQAIPRYFSTAPDGSKEREFLRPFFNSPGALASAVFLKGYQWPFDPDRVRGGSSLIDVLVYDEIVNKGRRVFVDFRSDPDGFDVGRLSEEASAYLRACGATQATPIERLRRMNEPAVRLFAEMGVDLAREPLEVAVCHQHLNGGFAVDHWWESNVRHLFVVGELAGTHGVKRPGGAALNAGQVGALRAAQRIAHVYFPPPPPVDQFEAAARPAVEELLRRIRSILGAPPTVPHCEDLKRTIQNRMSQCAGMVRSCGALEHALRQAWQEWHSVRSEGLRQEGGGYLQALRVRELALAQLAFLEAARALLERGSGSRGSHLVLDPAGLEAHPLLGGRWRFAPENAALREEVLRLTYDRAQDRFTVHPEPVRPIPSERPWFEPAWAAFREGHTFARGPGEQARPYRTDL